MIPQTFIDDLLIRADIVDVVRQYVDLKSAGANLQGLCPFHKEKSPSFSVSPSKQFYHCFGCGAHGNALSFLIEHLGLTFPEAVETLAGRMGLEVPHEKGDEIPQEVRSERESMHDIMLKTAKFYQKQLKGNQRVIQYLKGRGLTGEIAAKYGLGYSPDDYQGLAKVFDDYAQMDMLDEVGLTKKSEQDRRYDRFRDRVMFPIRNPKGQVIGFGGRVLDQGEPKYLNSPETPLFHKGTEVYGLHEARQAIHARGYVLVTEGYMDVVALAQWGFENAVATLGTAVTPDHVHKLFKQTSRLVFAFDGDKAGQKAAWRALQACLPHVSETKVATFIYLPEAHDPDSYIRTEGADAFEHMVAQAMPLSAVLIRQLKSQFQIGYPEGDAAAMHFLKPLVVQLQPTVYRMALVQELARLLDVTPFDLNQRLGLKSSREGQQTVWSGQGGRPREGGQGWQGGGRADGERRGGEGPWTNARGEGSGKGGQGGWGRGRDGWGRGRGEPMDPTRNLGRPQSKSPLTVLAARLIKVPAAIDRLGDLLAMYQAQSEPDAEVSSFLHLVGFIQQDPQRLEARLMHAFGGTGHQEWVNRVLAVARSLEESLDFETELADSVYQCCEVWFKNELQRLAERMPMSEQDRGLYQAILEQYQNLKRNRVNQL